MVSLIKGRDYIKIVLKHIKTYYKPLINPPEIVQSMPLMKDTIHKQVG